MWVAMVGLVRQADCLGGSVWTAGSPAPWQAARGVRLCGYPARSGTAGTVVGGEPAVQVGVVGLVAAGEQGEVTKRRSRCADDDVDVFAGHVVWVGVGETPMVRPCPHHCVDGLF